MWDHIGAGLIRPIIFPLLYKRNREALKHVGDSFCSIIKKKILIFVDWQESNTVTEA